MQENTNDSPEANQSDDGLPAVAPQVTPPPQQAQAPLPQAEVPAINTGAPSPVFGGVIQIDPIAVAAKEAAKGGDILLYVSAFTLSVALILGIVANIAGLLEIAFNHIGSDKAPSVGSYFGLDSYELKSMLWLVSSLLITTIVYVLLQLYLQKNKQITLNSFSTKVYAFVYGGFLTILGLAAISSFGNFVYSCLVPLVPKGAYATDSGPVWVGIVQSIITTLLLGFVLFYYIKKAKTSDRLSS